MSPLRLERLRRRTPISDLQRRVNQLPWFHEIDFGNGVVTPGATPREVLQATADIYFKDDVSGRTVIDIGCWDGFNSFEAKRRGAARVLATDHFAWSDQCWGARESFDLARENLGLEIDVLDIDLQDITPESVGTFDVVLFAGVLYHLRHPLLGLEQVTKICDGLLIVETHLDALDLTQPAMVFYPADELVGDPTNWWGPNAPCVIAMLKDVGFSRVELTPHPHPAHAATRGIFHAYK
jgi:tRNA (mo5U34)-methyltransferase